MSYASAAATPTTKPSAVPDQSLLTTHADVERATSPGLVPDEKVHIVDADEARKIKEGIAHAEDDIASQVEHFNKVRRENAKALKDALKSGNEKAVSEIKKRSAEIEKKGQEWAKESKKKAEEWEAIVQKEWEEGKDWAEDHPETVGGIVTAVNVALIAALGVAAYANWEKPHWDRRALSAIVIGSVSVLGLNNYVGFWEYTKTQK